MPKWYSLCSPATFCYLLLWLFSVFGLNCRLAVIDLLIEAVWSFQYYSPFLLLSERVVVNELEATLVIGLVLEAAVPASHSNPNSIQQFTATAGFAFRKFFAAKQGLGVIYLLEFCFVVHNLGIGRHLGKANAPFGVLISPFWHSSAGSQKTECFTGPTFDMFSTAEVFF